MGKKRKQLSQAEIWDDSALIQSWEDALTEYKLYHSIHARGERVEDVIKAAESEGGEMDMAADSLSGATANAPANGVLPEDLEDGELEDDVPGGEPSTNGILQQEEHVPSDPTLEQTQNEASEVPKPSHIPAAITDAVKDEGLKNLMMSWYYAGYYTGLYEGQQKTLDTQTQR